MSSGVPDDNIRAGDRVVAETQHLRAPYATFRSLNDDQFYVMPRISLVASAKGADVDYFELAKVLEDTKLFGAVDEPQARRIYEVYLAQSKKASSCSKYKKELRTLRTANRVAGPTPAPVPVVAQVRTTAVQRSEPVQVTPVRLASLTQQGTDKRKAKVPRAHKRRTPLCKHCRDFRDAHHPNNGSCPKQAPSIDQLCQICFYVKSNDDHKDGKCLLPSRLRFPTTLGRPPQARGRKRKQAFDEYCRPSPASKQPHVRKRRRENDPLCARRQRKQSTHATSSATPSVNPPRPTESAQGAGRFQGYPNIGNSCFVMSTLQACRSLSCFPLRLDEGVIEGASHDITAAFADAMANKHPDVLTHLRASLPAFDAGYDRFSEGTQQDAFDFLQCLMRILENGAAFAATGELKVSLQDRVSGFGKDRC